MEDKNNKVNYKDLYNFYFEHTDNLVLVLASDFTITDINITAQKVLGLKIQDVYHKRIDQIFLEKSIPSFIDLDKPVKKTRHISQILLCGKNLVILWHILPVSDSILILGKNVTELTDKQFEIFQLENVVKHAPGFFYWKDINSVYQGCNDEFTRLAGVKSIADVKGKTDFEMAWKDRANLYVEIDKKVIETGQAILNHEEDITIANNTTIIALTNKVPLFDKKKQVIGVMGITTDITHQKQVEKDLNIAKNQAEAANKAKSEFIANMSHDVRTPLTGVIGTADILEHSGDTDRDRELGHTIHTSAERLLQLLDDVLEVISADEGEETKPKLTTFSLQSRLDFIKELLIPSAKINEVSLNFNCAVPEYIVSDRIKIDRILLNLISNSLKFTHEGSITVGVKSIEETAEEAILEFNVTDTGIGIPEDQIDKIYERFYRGSPSYHDKYKGHGIGLFIVQKYISLLKGSISVQSKLGEGSNFKVILPVKIGKASDVKNEKETFTFIAPKILNKNQDKTLSSPSNAKTNIPSKKQNLKQRKVLVVEDDAVARRVVISTLTRAGFHVDEASNAELGFWHIMNNPYDFLLTDIGLPGMNGNELTAIIRAWERVTKRSPIKIIGLSAHGANQQASSLTAGMDLLLSKPLNSEKVKSINDRFFSKVDHPQVKGESPASHGQASILGYDLPNTEAELFLLENYPLFNEEEGIDASGSAEMLQELLTIFVNETFPEELPLLKEAHSKNDWSTVQSIAHKIKGGTLYVGTIRLRYACQYTERYKLAGHRELLEPLYQQLLRVIDQTTKFLDDWLKCK